MARPGAKRLDPRHRTVMPWTRKLTPPIEIKEDCRLALRERRFDRALAVLVLHFVPEAGKATCASRTIVVGKILDDCLSIVGGDIRAKRLDHLGDFGLPHCAGREWRIQDNIIEAVTGR